MSLADFERSGIALEIRVAALSETLWWVPRPEHVRCLVRRGIARGRVWTTGELRDLASIDPIGQNDVERIVRLKFAFGAEIVEVERDVNGRKT